VSLKSFDFMPPQSFSLIIIIIIIISDYRAVLVGDDSNLYDDVGDVDKVVVYVGQRGKALLCVCGWAGMCGAGCVSTRPCGVGWM